MPRTLDSDQLGKKGQQRFGEISVSAGLIPNEATWDRKGWDFVVDWRHDQTQLAFDERPTLQSCLVQVKTIWTESKAIRVPLLALEHIAKDLKPAFLYVITAVDDEVYGDAAFLAHLDDKLLALCLKSLRQARAAKRSRLSEVTLRLPLTKWFERIPQTGRALRKALEDAIGPSMGAYAALKQKKLRELGYEAGAGELSLKIAAASRDEFLDGFMGLRPLKFSEAKAADTRFGIPIPIPHFLPAEGELQVRPKPFGKCQLTIRDDQYADPIIFRGEMYGPPAEWLAPDELQTLIRTPLFDLRFSATGVKRPAMVKMKLIMNLDGEKIRNARLPASDWSNFYKFLAGATDNSVSVEMSVAKGKAGPLCGSLSMSLEGTPAETWPAAVSACIAAERVLRATGWPRTKLSISKIGESGDKLEVVEALLDDSSFLGPLSFRTSTLSGLSEGDIYEVLYVDDIDLGSHSVVYAVVAEMIASMGHEGVDWRSKTLKLKTIARVKTASSQLRQFVDRARRETGLQSVIPSGSFSSLNAC